jgi:hypothetical protein
MAGKGLEMDKGNSVIARRPENIQATAKQQKKCGKPRFILPV